MVINSIVVNGESVFFGTSPNGGIYKYSLDKLTKIYPVETDKKANSKKEQKESTSEANEPNIVETDEYLSNEHIFAMATDISGRILAGVSGDKCKLMRLESGKMITIFEPNDAKYIFSIAVDQKGNIFLGTGPEGNIYMLDSLGKKGELIYDSADKSILSLVIGTDGSIYAGSDVRGLVYKINPRTKKAKVLYDSEKEEITALLLGLEGNLYATATSAQVIKKQGELAIELPLSGRPDVPKGGKNAPDRNNGDLKLEVANTKKKSKDKPVTITPAVFKKAKPSQVSYIYKITKEGFVTDIFSESAVFFCMAGLEGSLLVGTGNKAQLYSVDWTTEQEKITYTDEQSSQITSITVLEKDVYIGTANPAKLIKLSDKFAFKGTYISDLIDAGNPARWGKLQIDADIPKGCKVLASSRSGNVKDVNDPTFSDWTNFVEVTEPVQLKSPVGRFSQYKLVLKSFKGEKTPVVREVAVAHSVANLAPKVESVDVSRIDAPAKKGFFKISYKSKDDNEDKLIYKIEFRKIGWENWIELEDEIETDNFEWDGKTVEDGKYEVRITANDERNNTTLSKLTSSRISDPVVVDNTGPSIRSSSVEKDKEKVTVRLKIFDELSVIGKVNYTIDSKANWIGTLPDDLVYDTKDEAFTIEIEDLEAGEHIISVRISDDIGNETYKSFKVNVVD